MKKEEIAEMKRALEKEGYAVIKVTDEMKVDMDECVGMENEGEEKDCAKCSASICLIDEAVKIVVEKLEG